jgi:hypothetical protein
MDHIVSDGSFRLFNGDNTVLEFMKDILVIELEDGHNGYKMITFFIEFKAIF